MVESQHNNQLKIPQERLTQNMFFSSSGYSSTYFTPFNDRIRKRKTFADQELMNSTLNCYLGYQHLQHMPTTTFSSSFQTSPQEINISNLLSLKSPSVSSTVISEPQTRSSKISFSIESIIGIK